jgi:hypothetical protein
MYRSFLAGLVLSLPAWLAACQTPLPPVHSSLVTSPELLTSKAVDIAVLPIEDGTPDRRPEGVLGTIRDELASALVGRLYSPMATAKVDGVLAREASARRTATDTAGLLALSGKFGEDAILAVRLRRWDSSSLMSDARVKFEADVTLFDSRTNRVLMTGGLEGQVKSGGEGPAPLGIEARHQDAGVQFGRLVAQHIPRRQV